MIDYSDDQFDWDCPNCGRHFEDMTKEEFAAGCPADDCPSHDRRNSDDRNAITTAHRQDAIRAMVDMHGIRLGLPADIRTTAIWLALSTYRADESSAWRAVEDGRYLLDEVHEGYALLDGLGVQA